MDFQVHKSRIYHAKFRGFYLATSNAAKVASAISATSAFAFLLSKNPEVATWLAAIVGVASTADLILQFDAKTRLHDGLCRSFTTLAADIVLLDATEDNLKTVKARRLIIENDEPTVRRLIDIQAQNEELRSRGGEEEAMVPLSRKQRILGYVFTFDLRRLERWKAYRQTLRKGGPLPPIEERGLIPPFPWSLLPFHCFRMWKRYAREKPLRSDP